MVRFGTFDTPNLTILQTYLVHGRIWDIQVWGIKCPVLDHIPDSIWDIPSWIWDKIEIPVWDARNRNSDLGYPKFNLGHGRVWTTTDPFKIFLRLLIFKYCK